MASGLKGPGEISVLTETDRTATIDSNKHNILWNTAKTEYNILKREGMTMMDEKDWLGADNQLGLDIWHNKYRSDGESFEQWLERVSAHDADVAELLRTKKFLFGGRILANRGLECEGKKITLSNCYVVEPPEDNIESIFDRAGKLARTYSYGGGCGIDISGLSPRGARINNAAKETSGSISFMTLYSLVTELIGQNGRRGALMISIDCTHPDLLDFIRLKTDLDKVTKANISIRLNKEFMDAVKEHKKFRLHFTRKETGQVIENIVDADAVIKAAAVADYRPKERAGQKIKKKDGSLFLELVRNPDILKELGEKKKQQVLVGFAAETERVLEYAAGKLEKKNLDFIVANDVSRKDAGFSADTNRVTILGRDGTHTEHPLMSKRALADIILDRVAGALAARAH